MGVKSRAKSKDEIPVEEWGEREEKVTWIRPLKSPRVEE